MPGPSCGAASGSGAARSGRRSAAAGRTAAAGSVGTDSHVAGSPAGVAGSASVAGGGAAQVSSVVGIDPAASESSHTHCVASGGAFGGIALCVLIHLADLECSVYVCVFVCCCLLLSMVVVVVRCCWCTCCNGRRVKMIPYRGILETKVGIALPRGVLYFRSFVLEPLIVLGLANLISRSIDWLVVPDLYLTRCQSDD